MDRLGDLLKNLKPRWKPVYDAPAVVPDTPVGYSGISARPETQRSGSASGGRESPFGLRVLAEGVEPTVDVVAIHGLNGHRDKTWTAENNVNWLRDQAMLPDIIPNARIMSWGYDANTHSNRPLSNMNLSQHAAKLVSDLCLRRKDDETDRRPLIFIVHSLGGIVLKDALILSDSSRWSHLHDHRAIKTSTYGIIFMGTPHQGGEGASLGQVILRIASVFINTNHKLLDILKRDSEILERQLGQYNAISSDFKTKFAFETYETPLPLGKKLVVVPRSSAVVPGHVDAEPIAIMSDHINMVKFESSADDGFRTVAGHIKIMAKEAPAKVQKNWQVENDRKKLDDAQRLKHDIDEQCFVLSLDDSEAKKKRELLHWLCDIDPSEIYNGAINKHQTGTSSWLVETKQFEHWETSAGSLLWLRGKVGSGKSVLSSFIIRHLREKYSSDPRTTVAQFFFSFHDAKKQTVAGMLASLVKQLCSSRADMPKQLKHLGQFMEKGERPDNKTLNDGLISLTHIFSAVYIVIDALEECPVFNSEQEDLLKVLRLFVNEMPPNVHVFCTSRNEQAVDTAIRPLLALPSRVELDLAAHRRSLDGDIEVYIDSVLTSDAYSTWPDDIKREAKTSLVERADGMFRYVYCQFEVLKHVHSPALVRQALDDLPVGLDATYDRMLRRIDTNFQNQVMSALKWLVSSRQAISLKLLADALILHPESPVVLDKGKRLFKPEACLKHVSGLVETYEVRIYKKHSGNFVCADTLMHVRLAHFSVKEYLISSRVAKCYAFTKMDAHLHVAHACLAYHVYRSSLGGEDHDPELQEYAAEEWAVHLEMVPRKQWPAEVTSLAARALAIQSESMRTSIERVAWAPSSLMGRLTGSWDTRYLNMAQRPLCYTASQGFVQLTDMLLSGGPGTNRYLTQEDLNMALVEAANTRHTDVVRLLLDSGANINAPSMEFGSPLRAAALHGSTEVVRFLLDRGADVDAQYGNAGSALQAAAIKNNFAVVQLLVDYGADLDLVSSSPPGCALASSVSTRDSSGRPWACLHFLLDRGANIDNHGGDNGTALCEAILYRHMKCVHLLLESGANVNGKAGIIGSALQAACCAGSKQVQLLLGKGAHVNAQGGCFGNALQAACFMSRFFPHQLYKGSLVEVLIDRGANINAQGGFYGNALQAVCGNVLGDCFSDALKVVREYVLSRVDEDPIDYSAGIDAQGGYYNNILEPRFTSSQPFKDSSIDDLLHGGVNIDAQSSCYKNAIQTTFKGVLSGFYGNALRTACENVLRGQLVNLLVPISASSQPYNNSIVEALIQKGAIINAQGGYYGNALQAACSVRSSHESYKGSVVEALINSGADINARGGYFGTALQAACTADMDGRLVRILLDKGADVNAQGGRYGNALQAAASRGTSAIKIMKLLLSRGARINEQGGLFGTALQAACGARNEAYECIAMLIHDGADVHARGGFFGSAWHAAAAQLDHEHDAVLQLLLDHGVAINDTQGRQHSTALEAAVQYGNQTPETRPWWLRNSAPDHILDRLRFLLDRGAKANLPSGKYGFPLQSACARDDTTQVAEFLLDNCPDIDVNAQGGVFGSALQAAAYSGHISLIRLLLDKGADINLRGGRYRSVLNAAVFRGFWDVVEVLLGRGAEPDSQQLPEPDNEWLGSIEKELDRGASERYRKFWEVQMGVGEAVTLTQKRRKKKKRSRRAIKTSMSDWESGSSQAGTS